MLIYLPARKHLIHNAFPQGGSEHLCSLPVERRSTHGAAGGVLLLQAPLAVIPPGVGPSDSFRDEGRGVAYTPLGVLLDGKNH